MARASWDEIRERRLGSPQASAAYAEASRAYQLGRQVRQLREDRGWTQKQLAEAAGTTQSAVARFEAGGTTPTIPVLERLAAAVDADLIVQVEPRPHVA